MTAARRKALDAMIGQIEELSQKVGDFHDEEREQFDELSEKAQESERGEKIDSAANALEEAVSSLDAAKDSILEAMGE
jgi:ABC-type transporter Mla subunit MlaD